MDAECKDVVPEASDASITRANGEFVLTPSVVGTTVDLEATGAAIGEAFSQADGASGTVSAAAVVTEKQPEITTEELSSIKDVLGTFSTSFKTSGASRSTNLQVGAAKINGRVLMPGEVLSGYECMQPFTVANGYRAATAYENGRSVDSIGGGVCQISTTLYNASLLAELEIVQRQNHSMTVGYVKPSMDAAIAGTYKDIKIRNPYDTPIYVEGVTSGKTLTFTIYGKETRPANRTLKFESVTLQVMGAGAPIEQVDNSLAPGARVKVDSGHTGLKSELYKCVYVDGELKERTLLNKDTYNASRPHLPDGTGGSGGNGSGGSGTWSRSGGSVLAQILGNACGNHASGSTGDPGGGKYASGGGSAGARLYAWSGDARRPGWKQQSGRK